MKLSDSREPVFINFLIRTVDESATYGLTADYGRILGFCYLLTVNGSPFAIDFNNPARFFSVTDFKSDYVNFVLYFGFINFCDFETMLDRVLVFNFLLGGRFAVLDVWCIPVGALEPIY